MQLEGLNVIVTGGASGLGKACAQTFARCGAHVFVADNNCDAGAKLAKDDRITFVPTDVTLESDVEALLDEVEATGKPARVLVNCAGVGPAMALWRGGKLHCVEAFDYTLKTNITGTFLPTLRFAWRLRDAEPIEEETGVIINTSSIAATEGQAGNVAYAATKGAVSAMTLPLARELAELRTRVNAIAPGPIKTPMLGNIPRASSAALGTQAIHPARLGKPDEFAALARHIVENPMINGEIIRLDGGLRVTPW